MATLAAHLRWIFSEAEQSEAERARLRGLAASAAVTLGQQINSASSQAEQQALEYCRQAGQAESWEELHKALDRLCRLELPKKRTLSSKAWSEAKCATALKLRVGAPAS